MLSNGVTFVALDKDSPTSTIFVTIKVGSNNEVGREKGISHFLEHMVFEGTTTRSSFDISSAIEGLGGEIGAYTSNEETCFYITVADRHTRKAAEILFDVLANPVFDIKLIEKERQVILSEIRQKHDEPRFYQWELFLRNLFPSHPAGSPISGTLGSVQSISRKILANYYEKYYSSGNAIVCFVGKSKSSRDIVENMFSKLRKGPQTKIPNLSMAKNKPQVFVKKPMNQSYLVFGYQGVPRTHPDSYVLDIIRAVIGKGLSGRLVNDIRVDRGLAYEVGCQNDSGVSYGSFSIYLNTKTSDVATCLERINFHLDSLKDAVVPKKELDEAKNFLEGELLMEIEESQKFAAAVSFWEYCGMGTDLKSYIRKIRSVTSHDVLRVARNLRNPTLVVIG